MNKLRSDSAFCQLTPEQIEALEGWLFEERLGYPKVLEKLKSEFGFETSLTAIRRFYTRLDIERSRESLMDAVEMSGLTVEALKSGDLKPAMLLLTNKCLFELLRQSPVPIKEVTTLLRAITSAEARAMKQTIYEREQAELREAERVRKARESWRLTPADLAEEKEALRRERAERKKAREEAAAKAAKDKERSEPSMNLPTPHSTLSPLRGEGVEACGQPGGSIRDIQPGEILLPKGGERNGSESGHAGDPASKETDGVWAPKVMEQEEREYAEDSVPEDAENRLTPLNAA